MSPWLSVAAQMASQRPGVSDAMRTPVSGSTVTGSDTTPDPIRETLTVMTGGATPWADPPMLSA